MSLNVLITGASRGIGKATALRFAREGFNIIITCSSSEDALKALQDEIQALGVKCHTFVGDISKYDQVALLFSQLKENNLIPDILVNNAAISYVGLLQDMSIEEWNRLMGINLTGAFNTCNQAIPYFISNKSGCIINISSMWGNCGASCEVAYSASKGGINAFTKALAKELAPSNIPVNAIAFGMVDTSMNSFLSEEERVVIMDEIPAGRILSPEEAADIIFDVSKLNTYITGQVITADGGYT